MFVRIRWFMFGAASAVAVLAYLSVQVKKARQKLTPAALVRSGGAVVANLLDRTADRVAPEPQNAPRLAGNGDASH